MGIFSPLMFVARSFNTVANLYFAGQVGFWTYKQVKSIRKEKMRASQLRKRFVEEYVKEYDEEPDEELIKRALRAYDAVESPVSHRVKNLFRGDK